MFPQIKLLICLSLMAAGLQCTASPVPRRIRPTASSQASASLMPVLLSPNRPQVSPNTPRLHHARESKILNKNKDMCMITHPHGSVKNVCTLDEAARPPRPVRVLSERGGPIMINGTLLYPNRARLMSRVVPVGNSKDRYWPVPAPEKQICRHDDSSVNDVAGWGTAVGPSCRNQGVFEDLSAETPETNDDEIKIDIWYVPGADADN